MADAEPLPTSSCEGRQGVLGPRSNISEPSGPQGSALSRGRAGLGASPVSLLRAAARQARGGRGQGEVRGGGA